MPPDDPEPLPLPPWPGEPPREDQPDLGAITPAPDPEPLAMPPWSSSPPRSGEPARAGEPETAAFALPPKAEPIEEWSRFRVEPGGGVSPLEGGDRDDRMRNIERLLERIASRLEDLL